MPGISKLVGFVVLHDTLNEFHRSHNYSYYKPSECSVFKSVNKAETLLTAEALVHFIRTKDDRIDKRYPPQRVVDAVEQLEETFVVDDALESLPHSRTWIHLHSDLQSVQNVTRHDVGDSPDVPAHESLQKVNHDHLIIWEVLPSEIVTVSWYGQIIGLVSNNSFDYEQNKSTKPPQHSCPADTLCDQQS